ncbi:MAG TPA: hypothetical protein VMS55_03720 [Myxococcota bacterium]|nr:hypothetical protein [Myxococcota bacterium]
MTTSRTRLGALLLVMALAAPASAQIPDAPTLLSALGLSQDQIQQITSGQIVRGAIQAASPRELVAAMAFEVKTPPAQLVSQLKSGAGAKTDPTIQLTGQFSGGGSVNDLAKLSLSADRAKVYTSASPGETLNLSTQEIATFDGLAGSDAATVTGAVKNQLLARLKAYQQQGLAGIAPYARESGTRSCNDELRTMAQASKALQKYVPAAYQYLLSYPNSKPAGTEETFRWSQIDAHGTPALTLTHVAFVPDGNSYVLLQRMFYVSATFNCEQALAAFMPVQGGTAVVYGNRTSTDQVEGWGGSAKRSIGSRLLESQLEDQFQKAQSTLGK